MTTKYCDHGAYGLTGSFSASTSGSSTTLTLTTPGSFTGVIKPGMFLSGTGISAETYISSVTYNASDVVTAITMSAARTVAAATTITATGAGAPEAVPVWGSAQDGDGTASTPGTPSTASIVFTGAPTTGSIAVCGVTLSPTWGATATTAADALAAAINASTTAITGPATFTTLSQLRNHIYARGPSTGAAAATCEIMTRQAAAHTGTAITHTLNNVSSGATIAFSGGTGGCWGYLFNIAVTAWKSGVAIGGYGIWAAAVPYCGTMAAGDIVKVRAAKTINLTTNTNFTWTMATMGSAAAPVRFDIDDGTVWSADGSSPVLKITRTATSNNSTIWSHAIGTYAHINGKQYGSGQRNLVLESLGSGPTIATNRVQMGGPVRFENMELSCPGLRTASSCSSLIETFGGLGSLGGAFTTFKNVKLVQPGQQVTANFIFMSANVATKVEFINCEFSLTDAGTAWSYVFSPFFTSTQSVTLDSCKFSGFVSGSRLTAASTTYTGGELALICKNCDFGNITIFGPSWLGATTPEFVAGMRGTFISSQYGNREFVIDRTGRLYCEWVAARGRPTLNARLRDGTTPWCIYAVPSTTAANVSKVTPVDLPRISKVIPANALLAEGVRTFTLNFLLESTLTWTRQDISILVDYMDSTGVIRTFDTYDPDGAALSTSTAAWTTTSWNGQTWSKKEFSVTTPQAVMADTEVAIYVRLHTSVSADTLGVIIDPEILIS